jgi:hypothetical protein
MAAYSYAGLEVRVTADTRQLTVDIKNAASSAGTDAASTISERMSAGLHAVGGLGLAVGKSVATGIAGATVAATAFGVESFKTAARVGEMDASLRALAKANGLSEAEMQKSVAAIRKQGIEAGTAQQLVAQFARNNLDLSKSTDLARVAQDAAVISGRNSTEVLGDLVHGITTQNSQVLRNAGLNVQAGQAVDKYAKSIGKATKDLTDAERSQAVLNAVLESGKTVAGAYAEAMTEPGKVLRSFPRLIDDIKLSVGEGLVQAFGPLILAGYDVAKALSAAVAPTGALHQIFGSLSVAISDLLGPVIRLVDQFAKWLAGLKPEQIEKMTGAIEKFGPIVMIAVGALTAMVAPGILSQIPVLGGVLTNLLGPAKLVAGGMGSIGQAALHSIPALSGVIGPAGGVGAALGGLALPVTAVVAALGALMIASKDFREAMFTLGRGLLDFLIPIVKALWENNLKPLLSALWQIVGAIGDALAPVIKELSKLLKPLGELFGQAAGGGAGGGGVSGLGAAINAVLPLILGLIKVIGFVLEVVVKIIVPIAEVAIKLLTWVQAITAVVNPIKLLGAALEWLIGIVSKLWHWITGNSPGLIPAFNDLFGVVGQVAGAVGGVLAAGFGKAVDVVRSATNEIGSVTSAAWSSMASGARAAGSSMVEGLKQGLSAAKSLGGWVQGNVTGPVVGFLKSGFGVFSPSTVTITIGDEMIDGLKQALAGAKQLGGWLQSNVAGPVVGAIRNGLDAAAMTPIGQQLIAGLQQGLSAAGPLIDQARSIAGSVVGAFKGVFGIHSRSAVMFGMGENMVAALEEGLDSHHIAVGPSITSPLLGDFGGAGALGGGTTTINVYPREHQDEQQIAAMVSRELGWAMAGGTA